MRSQLIRPLGLNLILVAATISPLTCVCTVLAEKPPGKTPIRDLTFVMFDVETTGFSRKEDRVIEVGAVKVKAGTILDERTWLIQPEQRIPFYATAVHGITDAMVRDQPTFAECADEIIAFFGDSVLFAHNAPFDVGFLSEEFKRAGRKPPAGPVLDSLRLFRKWFPDSPAHSLGALMAYLSLEDQGFHRATADARYIQMILEAGLPRHRSVKTLRQLTRDAGEELRFTR